MEGGISDEKFGTLWLDLSPSVCKGVWQGVGDGGGRASSFHSSWSRGGNIGLLFSSTLCGSQHLLLLVLIISFQSATCCSCKVPSGDSFVTVVKRSSNATWYCRVIDPVRKFWIIPIWVECSFEKPRNWPLLACGLHFDSLQPSCNLGSNTYVGQPQTWFCLIVLKFGSKVWLIISFGVRSCPWLGKLF